MSHVDEGTLHSYLDGELPASERAAVEAHLAQCAACRAALTDERALLERASALLGSARPVERPAPPFEQIRRAPKRSPWRVRTSLAWAASIVLALGLGYYLRNPGSDSAALSSTNQPTVVAENRDALAPTPAPVSAARAERQQRPAAPSGRRDLSGFATPPPTEELARLQASADSLATADTPAPPAAGAVALKSSAQLRNANPTPAAAAAPPAPKLLDTVSSLRLDEAVVSRAVGQASRELRGRTGVGTTQWQIISRGAATSLLGTDPVGLPGLATRRIRRSPAPDATVVVEQALDSSTVIQIFQRPVEVPFYAVDGTPLRRTERDRAAREAAPAAAPTPADRLARFVGRLRVEISGPLSLDSLNKLLEQVEPLP